MKHLHAKERIYFYDIQLNGVQESAVREMHCSPKRFATVTPFALATNGGQALAMPFFNAGATITHLLAEAGAWPRRMSSISSCRRAALDARDGKASRFVNACRKEIIRKSQSVC